LLTLFLFLDRSGYDLVVPNDEVVETNARKEEREVLIDSAVERMILKVVEDRLSYDELVRWFRARLRRRG